MRLVFVCTANMCRSPLAEHLCRRELAARGLGAIQVTSAGVFATPGRPAIAGAVRAGKALDLDLSLHASRPFDATMATPTDLIFVMEDIHRRQLVSRFGLDPSMVRLLGSYATQGGLEIDDPIGGPDVAFEHCVGRLQACLAGLLTWLEEHHLTRS